MIRKTAKLQVLTLCLYAAASVAAFAENDRREPPAEVKAAFEACATELGFAKPSEGQRPSEGERQKMHACVEAKGIKLPEHGPGGHHGKNFAAMKACLDAAGVQMPAPPADGTRPVFDATIKAAMDSCRAQVDRQTASVDESRVGVGDSSSDVSN